jgi:type I restriction enzyme S subunit
MGSEWKELPASEFCDSVRDGTHDSPKQVSSGKLLVTSRHITGNRLDLSSAYRISNTDYDEINRRSKVDQWDVLFTMIGTVGEPCLVSEEPNFAIKNIGLFKNTSETRGKFLYYYLCSPEAQHHTKSHSRGTTQQYIPLGELRKFPVRFPSDEGEMKAIAHILGTLDDKIELNRRMNATLEGMAQALFKSWFVDFDPVIDNALAAGNPIPAELAPRAEVRRQALSDQKAGMTQQGSFDHSTLSDRKSQFPAAFQFDDELGWIPEGWEPREVGDFAEIKHGYAFKGEYFSSEKTDDILVTPGNFRIGGGFKSDKLKYYDGPIAEDYVLTANDLIVTMTDLSKAGDTLGYPAFVPPSDHLTYHHNQRVGLVNLKTQKIGNHYLYQIFKSTAYRDEILGSLSGSTVKHTSPSKISVFKFPFSGGALEQGFEEESRAIEAKITLNDSASETLTKLRDTLLPKLISGEIAPSSTAVQGTELFSYAQEVTS